jgi:hypothetical protein
MINDKTKSMVAGAFRDLVKDVGKTYIEVDDLRRQVLEFKGELEEMQIRDRDHLVKVKELHQCLVIHFPAELDRNRGVFECAISVLSNAVLKK